jgi:glycosyltransferase involved in cell wall biosynthesis
VKIGLVGPTFPYRGGISHYTTLLARELAGGHEVFVENFRRLYPELLFPGRTQLDESGNPLEVPSRRILDSLLPWTWSAAGRDAARERPDLVVFQWWHPFFALAYRGVIRGLARSSRAAVLFLCHNVLPHEATRLDRLLLSAAFARPHGFLVHSAEDRDHLLAFRPGAPVRVAPHPTYDVFARGAPPRAEARRRLGLSGDVLLFFGYVRAYKGLRHLIEALPGILERRKVTLLVVGEFYEKKEPYLERVRRLGVAESVIFVDRYVPNEEVGLYFAAADLVVQPYVTATQSGITQIAFGFGRPVVVTRVGGLPDVVEDGKTGFLVPPEDPGAVRDAVLRFFDEGLGPAMEEAVASGSERFSWNRLADSLLDLHGEVARGD